MVRLLKPLGVGLLGVALLLSSCSGATDTRSGRSERVAANHELVANYCAYGASSWRQFQICIFNTDAAQISRLKTNAARYGRGELVDCLSDAGRFCRQGRTKTGEYPASWKRLLDLRHVRKGRPDPQCGYYYRTVRADIDAESGYDRCASEVELYCQYSAVSRAQLQGCKKNVTWGQIKRSGTNAARYSRLELDRCLADAGPFCRSLEPDYDR